MLLFRTALLHMSHASGRTVHYGYPKTVATNLEKIEARIISIATFHQSQKWPNRCEHGIFEDPWLAWATGLSPALRERLPIPCTQRKTANADLDYLPCRRDGTSKFSTKQIDD